MPTKTTAKPAVQLLSLTFSAVKETKGTWKFSEDLASGSDEPKIGTLYVRKPALDALGYIDGGALAVSIEIAP